MLTINCLVIFCSQSINVIEKRWCFCSEITVRIFIEFYLGELPVQNYHLWIKTCLIWSIFPEPML